jgi:YD repeat-containing protein
VTEKWWDGAAEQFRSESVIYGADEFQLVAHIGPAGNVVSGYAYGDANWPRLPTTITNAAGEQTSYSYTTGGRRATRLTPSNLSRAYGYSSGWPVSVVDSMSGTPLRTNHFTWSAACPATHTDPRGLTRSFTWDGLLRLTSVGFPDASSFDYRYTNAAGAKLLDLTAVKDRLGNWTCSVYHGVRQVTWTVDPLGRLTTVSDGLGTTSHTYDNLSRLVAVSNAFGLVQGVGYDLEDRPTWSTNANGVIVQRVYDEAGRLRTNAYPDGGPEAFGYTYGFAAPTSYTNQLGTVTLYAYDAAGRKTSEVYVGQATNSFTYWPAGDLLTLRDGKTQQTGWGYDTEGRVTSKTNANNVKILAYSYDANGRLTNRWMAVGSRNTGYAHDAVGNLTNVDYAVSTDLRFAYDALNRLTNMVDAAGTTAYAYVPGGQVLTEGLPAPPACAEGRQEHGRQVAPGPATP